MATLPEPLARPVRRFLATRPGARVLRTVVPPADRMAKRLTGGRHTVSELLMPTLTITTTGRRSGQPRTQHLVFQEHDGGWAVVGTNWGQGHHPAWTHNLLAEPAATIELGHRTVPVRARLLEGDERATVYARFERLGPNFAQYDTWSGEREIRVFVLEPRD